MTNRLHTALERITGDLTRQRRRFALVGGVAVSVRAEPRLTRDLDLAVAVESDADAEARAPRRRLDRAPSLRGEHCRWISA